MKLFAMAEFAILAAALREAWGCDEGRWEARRFANEECYITVHEPVAGEKGVVLASIAPPDRQFIECALLCHTLKKEQAARVIAVLPYLAYARQEKVEPGRSQATPWVGGVLRVSGIDALVTVDIHSPHTVEALAMPVRSVSSAPIFAEEILRVGWGDATLVAPDRGALPRCEAVRAAMGSGASIVHCVKKRSTDGVSSVLQGNAGRHAVVIDDILDTGNTLVACCQGLQQAGTDAILVMVTHGLFTGEAWQQLWELGVAQIICTDTVPFPLNVQDPRIRIVSILPVLTAEDWMRW